jgi:hypothetical protein
LDTPCVSKSGSCIFTFPLPMIIAAILECKLLHRLCRQCKICKQPAFAVVLPYRPL